MSSFKVSDKVRLIDNRRVIGTIQWIEHASVEGASLEMQVNWGDDDEFYESKVYTDEVEHYDSEADAQLEDKVNQLLSSAKISFEAAFEAFREANNLVNPFGGMAEFMETNSVPALKELEDLYDANGWSSSSLYC